MIARPDVDELLAGPLGGWLAKQALARKEAKALAVKRWTKAVLFGLPFLAFIWVLLPFFFQINIFLTLLVAGGGYAWGNAPRKKAIRTVKVGINEAIAKSIDLSYSHDLEPGIGYELGCRYRLLQRHDRSRFEDLWSGTIGARAFTLHEAHLEKERKSNDSKSYVTVFRGAIMTIDFARNFHGTTLVERESSHKGFFGGRKESIELDGQRLDLVDLVHPDFEDNFVVFSSDQVEARYLVHPQYVERLLSVERAFDGKDIRAVFHGGELVIAIETGNMFESGSIEANDDREMIVRTVEQFASLADLAQSLNEPARGSPAT